MIPDGRTTSTARLELRPVDPVADLEALHALHADPAVWRHFPSGRHTTVAATQELLADAQASWATGLGPWTVREAGRVLGMAGCSARPRGGARRWWNLYYRFAPEAQGRGLAREAARAALAAAAEVDPVAPVVAFLLEHNQGSRALAERLGLTLAWRGPEEHGVRLVYADRELDKAVLVQLGA